MLLINKSDFLSPELIAHWNEYFTQKGVNHIFFSAIDEQAKIDAEELLEREEAKESEDEEVDSDDSVTCSSDGEEQTGDQKLIAENPIEKSEMELEIERQEREDAAREAKQKAAKIKLEEGEAMQLDFNTQSVFTREQLIAVLKKKTKEILHKVNENSDGEED